MNILKTFACAALLPLSVTPAYAAPTSPAPVTASQQAGEHVTAHVNGLVCDFCAQAILKLFGREAAIAEVDVDLGDGEVRLRMKPGQTMTDSEITSLIRRSGYALTRIDREQPE